jgi:hypothetical protein
MVLLTCLLVTRAALLCFDSTSIADLMGAAPAACERARSCSRGAACARGVRVRGGQGGMSYVCVARFYLTCGTGRAMPHGAGMCGAAPPGTRSGGGACARAVRRPCYSCTKVVLSQYLSDIIRCVNYVRVRVFLFYCGKLHRIGRWSPAAAPAPRRPRTHRAPRSVRSPDEARPPPCSPVRRSHTLTLEP